MADAFGELRASFDRARVLLRQFKGDSYLFGTGILPMVGQVVASIGKTAAQRPAQRAALVRGTFPGSDKYVDAYILRYVHTYIRGARPNCPREDVFRIAAELKAAQPDVVISFGGGSTIDATKAAVVLSTLGGEIDSYFGTGLVTAALGRLTAESAERAEKKSGIVNSAISAVSAAKHLTPHVAIQTAASSAAHLTKYSNITDVSTGQKKLIVDDAIVPAYPVFDYEVTYSAPPNLTADGAMDGIAHCLEVLYGAVGRSFYGKAAEIAGTGIALAVKYLPRVMADPQDKEAREAICLATDMGGYAIMIGGTNGGHLTSFSLVDILTHGRACAIMNPYYTVFFAPAIEEPLRLVGSIYRRAGLTKADIEKLQGRELGIAVAEAMFELARRIGFPTRLNEVRGFRQEHIERALIAAKNPQLKMKLQNMPVPLTAEMVDQYMRPVLEAARDGDLSLIKNVTRLAPGPVPGAGPAHSSRRSAEP
jgi:alcohol dehydrogenase class IV